MFVLVPIHASIRLVFSGSLVGGGGFVGRGLVGVGRGSVGRSGVRRFVMVSVVVFPVVLTVSVVAVSPLDLLCLKKKFKLNHSGNFLHFMQIYLFFKFNDGFMNY